MKIGDSKPINSPTPVRRVPGYNAQGGQSAQIAAASASVDSASIMGIPEAEVTPKVRDALMALMAEVETLRRELRSSQHRIQDLEEFADKDPLVPIPNRRAFVRELSRLISFAERYEMPASVIYLDLNNLKQINDTHGHAAGDAALVGIGEILSENVRESDVVGRLGGDEFGVILANANETAANQKAESLAAVIANSIVVWEKNKLSLSAAYGVYTFEPGEDAASAMAKADRDMYQRKRTMKSESAEPTKR
jgi:diguanylate cyclase (GGDEF)-like protein